MFTLCIFLLYYNITKIKRGKYEKTVYDFDYAWYLRDVFCW